MNISAADAARFRPFSQRFDWAAYSLGFALSGFFDGILLHQVLQWHHLLSGLRTGVFADLRVQVMADGLFHAGMYAIAVVGLWQLYRARSHLARPGANRRFIANFWIGFGVWHVLDALLSHWLIGIHRIRMDVAHPLPWDVAWLVLFGVVPLVIGLRLRRRGGSGTASGPGGNAIAMLVVALAFAAGALNAYPVRANASANTTAIVLRPGASAADLLAALDGTAARILWVDPQGAVWVIAAADPPSRLTLYRHGAMYVSGTFSPAGCSAWLRPGGRSSDQPL